MHDNLRRRALESGKTVSNKAKSKPSSKASSRGNSHPNSRGNSRLQSRDASDDEDLGGNLSDDTNHSINSIDELLESEDFNEQTTDVMKQELSKSIDDLLERKGSSTNSREESLSSYDRCLTAHHLADTLHGRVRDILAALSRSVKAEVTEKETTLAIRGIALTAISIQDETIYENMAPLLKRVISDSQYPHVKAIAIDALATCISFGGAGPEEIEDTLTFLLEVVSSDGSFIGADDSPEVVAAALVAYGFLATQVDDLEADSEDAVATFLDQLDANEVKVQIAAGENIALLYEKSYTPRSYDDDSDEDEAEDDQMSSEDDVPAEERHLVKRYNAYHDKSVILDKVQSLASLSTKSLNRKDKRDLHQAFASISSTIENPRVGPSTNSASKMTIRIHREGEMKVDKWWKLMRLNAIRRLLGGGFVNHYFEGNKQVLEVLPVIMRQTGAGLGSPRKLPSKQSKGRYREQRRFVSVGANDEGW